MVAEFNNHNRQAFLPVPESSCPSTRRRQRVNPQASLETDQLHVKYQHPLRCAGDSVVGKFCGDPQTASFTHDHQLQTLGPTWNHAVVGKLIDSPRVTEESKSLPSVVQPE